MALICFVLAGPVTLTVALGLGAIGDIFLSRDGEQNFLAGLGAFLFGDGAYILLLAQVGEGVEIYMAQPWRIAACILLVGIALFITNKLRPHLGALKIPVLVYVSVITMMGMMAFSLSATWPLGMAILGVILFITSDSILGFETFVFDPAGSEKTWSSPLLWFLYWGGQLIITAAVLMSINSGIGNAKLISGFISDKGGL